jgi:hypothetical protein
MGKYPPPIYDVLVDDTPGESKRILDLGCGSGSWWDISTFRPRCALICCIRMLQAAADFPHCDLVAVDLVPMQLRSVHRYHSSCNPLNIFYRDLPQNCRLEFINDAASRTNDDIFTEAKSTISTSGLNISTSILMSSMFASSAQG